MRSRAWTTPIVVIAAAGLTACGGDDAPPAPPQAAASGEAEPGPFFDECGAVTDDEVARAFAVPGFTTVTRNSVGCEWEVAGTSGPSVTFSWYRGSPIGRERAGSELIGRAASDIEIAGQPGFVASAGNYLCELGVAFGGDFVHWSIMYGESAPTADPCDVARELAETSISRAER
ncbi:DUF3558 domain-containing protein [Rhodococcus rhodnii]|uniref:Lipoprotein LprB n=2 Tax=Rhodococcus rhodnii TaxID=38312 RepID=R7WJW6_9NOCA|nr:DUF3558 domain-containing protein [Rhodococcus rhodnii]EOM75575.1 lipoprotein LprB [Rhodococcus rhodnii LMG 5362]TXG91899.1 DUF3558 domain-containing protein [Rhodococcus rhodnii]